MKEFINSYGDHIPMMEVDDFSIGDHVKYTQNFLGICDYQPLYLEDCTLSVVGKTKRKVICTCEEHPGREWRFNPLNLKILKRW